MLFRSYKQMWTQSRVGADQQRRTNKLRKVEREMENNNETMKELDQDQMVQISGGAKIFVCPYCGQEFTERKLLAHGKKCRIEHQGITLDGTRDVTWRG